VLDTGKVQTISGTGEAEIEFAVIINSEWEPVEVVNVGETITLWNHSASKSKPSGVCVGLPH
jgi:hypothetical protein